MGAVMGSKNLKAIAVKGTGKVPVIDHKVYSGVRSRSNRAMRSDNLTEMFRTLGTAGGSDYFDYLGEMPKKGFTRGLMDGVERISGATLAETIVIGVSTCHACVIACGRVVQLEDGEKRKGPEYETIVGFGPNLLIDDPEAVTLLGELCDRYGMDTISLSNTISLAFTLFALGIITENDTEGLKLEWGNADLVMDLVKMTAKLEGFGVFLAEGARALGRQFSSEELAVQVNGLEVAYHDPRGATGMALVYATSPRGACHNQSDYYSVDIGKAEIELGMEFYPHQAGAEKAANVAIHQNWVTVSNSLVMCIFANMPPQTVVDLINPACGYEWTLDDVMRAGERAWNLKRAINNRLGLTSANDTLPKTLLEPLPDGGAAGYVIDFEAMLAAYYDARGWDRETGYPSKEKLESLDLGWVAKELWPEN
jgi:aldehyde:ferredoxin oxidoreductase